MPVAPSGALQNRPLVMWLFAVAALIFIMVIVGGITRHTESGLSMTDWKPVTGFMPPLNETQWQAEFDKYKNHSEYAARVQSGRFTLQDFKEIFFWEWAHRVLGRIIGLAFALPFFTFWALGRIPKGYKIRLACILALGGLQGFVGWWMVQSGLGDIPEVSHLHLSAHLGLALSIFALTLWTAFSLKGHIAVPEAAPLKALSAMAITLTFLQIILGAWVVGLEAGYVAVDWPLMNGDVVPSTYWAFSPFYENFAYNPMTVQFNHRLGAYILVMVSIIMAFRGGGFTNLAGGYSLLLLTLVAVQILLGVITLIYGVPEHVAITHQAVAVLILGAAVRILHLSRDATNV